MNDRNEQTTLHAATIALLAEGVAVTLFLACMFVWFGVLSGRI
jgi:hypothetical protein